MCMEVYTFGGPKLQAEQFAEFGVYQVYSDPKTAVKSCQVENSYLQAVLVSSTFRLAPISSRWIIKYNKI